MKNNFFGLIKSNKPKNDDEDPRLKRKITSAVRWTDAGLGAVNERKLRRIKVADTRRTTKKFRKRQAQQRVEVARYAEKVAVQVLHSYEDSRHLGRGGLRLHLIEEGFLSPTRPVQVGEIPVQMTVDGETVDAIRPLIEHRPIGHTPTEILAAAGLDEAEIARIHSELEAAVPA